MSDDLSNFSMMELFRMEAETHAAVLADGLIALEENPGATESVAELMRAAHSLKGAARIVGLDPAVDLAHVMEDCFVSVQKGKISLAREDVDVLLRGVDRLKSISELSDEDLQTELRAAQPDIDSLIRDLNSVCDPQSKAAEPASTAGQSTAPASVVESKSAELGDSTPAPEPQPELAPTKPQLGVGSAPTPAPQAGSSGDNPPQLSPASKTDSPEPAAVPAKDLIRPDLGVRVTGQTLSRLMDLAAESLVEARRLEPIVDAFLSLKKAQDEVESSLSVVRRLQEQPEDPESASQSMAKLIADIDATRVILQERMKELGYYLRQSTDIANRLYQEVLASRMRPFGDGVKGYPRFIRDLSRQLGKQVKFAIRGESTPVDRDILEKLDAPLNHLLRNALDHGLETPEQRRQQGKSEEGHLDLESYHRGGMLNITVADDGGGVDLEDLKEKIIARKLASPEIVQGLTDQEVLEFLFLPAFSTAEKVTEIPGVAWGWTWCKR